MILFLFYAYFKEVFNVDDSIGKSKRRCGQEHNGSQSWNRPYKVGQEGFACRHWQSMESDGNAWLAAD